MLVMTLQHVFTPYHLVSVVINKLYYKMLIVLFLNRISKIKTINTKSIIVSKYLDLKIRTFGA